MINTLSSSLRTHCTIFIAPCASAARLVFGGATAYNSNNGVLHASAMQLDPVSWWIFRLVGLACNVECKCAYNVSKRLRSSGLEK